MEANSFNYLKNIWNSEEDKKLITLINAYGYNS